jgi:hypothetical protein
MANPGWWTEEDEQMQGEMDGLEDEYHKDIYDDGSSDDKAWGGLGDKD